jgi:hemerythrin
MSEERQMEKRGFPGYAMHLRQHQAMYLELSSLCAGLAANVGESTCLFRSVSFIAAWYSKHVATADTAFAAWLEEQQSA